MSYKLRFTNIQQQFLHSPVWMILPKTFLPFFHSFTGQFHRWSFSWFLHSSMASRIALDTACSRPGLLLARRRCFFRRGMLMFVESEVEGRMSFACRPSMCVTWSAVKVCDWPPREMSLCTKHGKMQQVRINENKNEKKTVYSSVSAHAFIDFQLTILQALLIADEQIVVLTFECYTIDAPWEIMDHLVRFLIAQLRQLFSPVQSSVACNMARQDEGRVQLGKRTSCSCCSSSQLPTDRSDNMHLK